MMERFVHYIHGQTKRELREIHAVRLLKCQFTYNNVQLVPLHHLPNAHRLKSCKIDGLD